MKKKANSINELRPDQYFDYLKGIHRKYCQQSHHEGLNSFVINHGIAKVLLKFDSFNKVK